jgi:anti-sigma28 factor (negative regulator of flagellin synthesis)
MWAHLLRRRNCSREIARNGRHMISEALPLSPAGGVSKPIRKKSQETETRMKTNEVNSPAVVAPVAAGPERRSQDATVAVVPTDRATLAQSDYLRTSIANNVNVAASERAVRIHALTQQVRSGTYRPNSTQLAEQILAEAAFDADLAATLS